MDTNDYMAEIHAAVRRIEEGLAHLGEGLARVSRGISILAQSEIYQLERENDAHT